RIEGFAGEWFAHAEMLERPWKPRTVVLSPFDDLVSDRDHTETMFDFHFRLEIYVPKAKRRWGYFVLPILHGDRLIGRVDPRFDREARVLHLNAVHAEEGTKASDGAAAGRAVRELADWLGAREVVVGGPVPSAWRRSITG
ncbi:MAG: DNA glycosylase AlkZ-like family protein, partial [Actinomycetota bacterium]